MKYYAVYQGKSCNFGIAKGGLRFIDGNQQLYLKIWAQCHRSYTFDGHSVDLQRGAADWQIDDVVRQIAVVTKGLSIKASGERLAVPTIPEGAIS